MTFKILYQRSDIYVFAFTTLDIYFEDIMCVVLITIQCFKRLENFNYSDMQRTAITYICTVMESDRIWVVLMR